MKKKVLFFTSTRADYGIWSSLIKTMSVDSSFEVQILASGTHLEDRFGKTINEIEQDGLVVSSKVDISLNDNSALGICHSQGIAIDRYAVAIKALAPDLAFVLGDRFETLSFALACAHLDIPLVHIHGGELTIGSLDDVFRHCITKLSLLHFTSTEEYRQRVIHLGENPERVFNVGSLSVEKIMKEKFLTKNELEESLGIEFKEKNILITFHPEAESEQKTTEQINDILSGMDLFDDKTLLIFTMANADKCGNIINQEIEKFVAENPNRSVLFKSLGIKRYLSVLKVVDMVIGNSSSGILEVPSFNIPTINLGDRQLGRTQASSIVNAVISQQGIRIAIEQAWELKESLRTNPTKSPYQKADTQKLIIDALKNYDLPNKMRKTFYEKLD